VSNAKEIADKITKAMEGVSAGKWCQFHPSYAPEAEGTPFSDWDSSHDMSAVKDGKRTKRLATFKHADDAAYVDLVQPHNMRVILSALPDYIALLPGEPICHLVWRQGRIAIDDVADYYEVAGKGDKSVDGSDPFPVYTSPAPHREGLLEDERRRRIEAEVLLDEAKGILEWYASPEIYQPHPHGPAFDRRDLSACAKSFLSKLEGSSNAEA
jgi:hypothetical protein